jgi:hypothetical protein
VKGEKEGRREGKDDDEGVEKAVCVIVICKEMVMTSNDNEEVQ